MQNKQTQLYVATNHPAAKSKVSKVYTTKRSVDFIYLQGNDTITLPELEKEGYEITLWSSRHKETHLAAQEYEQFLLFHRQCRPN